MGKWYLNRDARRHTKDLLSKAGFPLEMRVARSCRDFEESHRREDISITSGRVVYGDPSSELREIDNYVNVHERLDAPWKTFDLQVMLEIPIECKHRNRVEAFGFPYQKVLPPHYPLLSGFGRATFLRKIAAHVPEPIRNEPYSAIGLVEIEKGENPKRVSDENLVYKAGAAVCDLIRFTAGKPETFAQAVIERMGLLKEFVGYVRKHHYFWWQVMPDWLDELPATTYRKFNRLIFGSTIFTFLVHVYFPMICIDSPLHEVSFDKAGGIRSFKRKKLLVTGLRFPGWLGQLRYQLASPSPEVLITVVDPEGLQEVLGRLFRWYESILASLRAEDSDVICRAPLESQFMLCAGREFEKIRPLDFYRSDLGRWL
jgi:hypothetical protein